MEQEFLEQRLNIKCTVVLESFIQQSNSPKVQQSISPTIQLPNLNSCTTILSLIAVIFCYQTSYAQINSRLGFFEVNYDKGCEGAEITLSVKPPYQCPCNVYPKGVNEGTIVQITNRTPPWSAKIPYPKAGVYDLELSVTGETDPDNLTNKITIHESKQPAFDAFTCSGEEVFVDITDINYDQYRIDYGDGTVVIVAKGKDPTPHKYATNGTYEIEVKGQFIGGANNCATKTIRINTLPTLPNAKITKLVLKKTAKAELTYSSSNHVTYFLEIQAMGKARNKFSKYLNTPLPYDASGITTFTLDRNVLDFDKYFYCFRIATFDPCYPTKPISYSNTLCSIDLEEIIVRDEANRLTINTPLTTIDAPYFHRDQVNGDQYDGASRFDPIIVPSLTASHTDNDRDNVKCNTDYIYTVSLTHKVGGEPVTTTSLPRKVTSKRLATPTPLSDISIDATDKPIFILPAPTRFVPSSYTLSTLNSSKTYPATAPITDSEFTKSSMPTCYSISYKDECNLTSSVVDNICTMYLSASKSGNQSTLNWTPYSNWINGVAEYQLIRTINNANPTILYTGQNTSFVLSNVQADQKVIYQVIATANDPQLTPSKSNLLLVINRSNITFPNAFIVNGISGNFKPVGRYITNIDIKIYSRWGELVAHITDINKGWDGKLNGGELPEGNYIYIGHVKDEAGNTHKHEGTVLLLYK